MWFHQIVPSLSIQDITRNTHPLTKTHLLIKMLCHGGCHHLWWSRISFYLIMRSSIWSLDSYSSLTENLYIFISRSKSSSLLHLQETSLMMKISISSNNSSRHLLILTVQTIRKFLTVPKQPKTTLSVHGPMTSQLTIQLWWPAPKVGNETVHYPDQLSCQSTVVTICFFSCP